MDKLVLPEAECRVLQINIANFSNINRLHIIIGVRNISVCYGVEHKDLNWDMMLLLGWDLNMHQL